MPRKKTPRVKSTRKSGARSTPRRQAPVPEPLPAATGSLHPYLPYLRWLTSPATITALCVLLITSNASYFFSRRGHWIEAIIIGIVAVLGLLYFFPTGHCPEARPYRASLARRVLPRVLVLGTLATVATVIGTNKVLGLYYQQGYGLLFLALIALFFAFPSREVEAAAPLAPRPRHPFWEKLSLIRAPLVLYGLLLLYWGQNAFRDHRNGVGFAWALGGVLLACFAFHRLETTDDDWQGQRWQSRFDLPILALIVVFSIALRFYDLQANPPGCSLEENLGGSLANELRGGMRYPIFLRNVQFHCPVTYYQLLALVFKFFPMQLLTLRAFSCLVGVASLVFFYLLLLEVYGRRLATIATVLLASSALHLFYSRQGWMWPFIFLFPAATLYFLFLAWRTGRNRYYLLSGLCMGLAQHCYSAAKLLPLVVLALVVYRLVCQKGFFKRNTIGLALMGIASFIAAAPIVVYALRNPAVYMQRIDRHFFFREIPTNLQQLASLHFLLNIKRHLLMFFSKSSPSGYFNLPDLPLLDIGTAILCCLGLGYCFFRFKNEKYFLPLAWFLAGMVGGFLSQHPDNPNTQRCLVALPLPPLFAAIGLDLACRTLPRAGHAAWRYLKFTLIALVVVVISYTNARTFFVDYKNHPQVQRAFFYTEVLAADAVRNNIGDANVFLSTFYSYSSAVSFLVHNLPFAFTHVYNLDDLLIHSDDKDAVLVLEPVYADIEGYLREYFPNLQTTKHPDHAPDVFTRFKDIYGHPELLMVVYRIPRADIAAISGLEEKLYSSTGQPLPPGDNFFTSLRDPQVHAAEWKGYLHIPEYSRYAFKAEGGRNISVLIDGRPVYSSASGPSGERAFSQGLHHVKITARASSSHGPLALLWKPQKQPTYAAIEKKRFLRARAGKGLRGDYYSSEKMDAASFKESKVEPMLCFRAYMCFYRGGNTNFSAKWQGVLNIEQTGLYLFEGNDWARFTVYIDDRKVFKRTGHETPLAKKVRLAAGPHRLRVEYHYTLCTTSFANHSVVHLYWTPPGGEKEILPWNVLSVD